MKAQVELICAGKAQAFRGEENSAFVKMPIDGPARIGSLGIDCDEQADRKHHGGIDMAVHHYPHDHYAWWGDHLGGHELLGSAPAFGENLVVTGITEADVHLGDQFRLGKALLEISQPRQPCWKIEHRFGRKNMVASIIKQCNCGWYYRVIEEGEARAGVMLERVATGQTNWSVARAFAALYSGNGTQEELRELSELEVLSAAVRTKAATKLR